MGANARHIAACHNLRDAAVGMHEAENLAIYEQIRPLYFLAAEPPIGEFPQKQVREQLTPDGELLRVGNHPFLLRVSRCVSVRPAFVVNPVQLQTHNLRGVQLQRWAAVVVRQRHADIGRQQETEDEQRDE